MSTSLNIRLAEDRDLSVDHVRHLAALINSVYDVAEAGMWKAKGIRTTHTEVAGLLATQSLILAERDGVTVGSVHVRLLPESLGEFGMLVAEPALRSQGIGRALVQAAEDWARGQGCYRMRLELLTPREWAHPSKVFLADWYTRLGYRPDRKEPLETMYPRLVRDLSTPCDFTIWLKEL